MNKANLRSIFRNRRRTLNTSQQRTAADNLCRQILRLPHFNGAKNIALYFANDGEISPHKLAYRARAQNKITWYPVLTRKQMSFRVNNGRSKLWRNRYGIAEPLPKQKCLDANQLDIVLLPLVAFDRAGNRLGMGGGYYDRTFAFKRRIPHHGPLLVGLAHALQEHTELTADNWDIPLDYIVTDREIIAVN